MVRPLRITFPGAFYHVTSMVHIRRVLTLKEIGAVIAV